jgi:hypothetical protein
LDLPIDCRGVDIADGLSILDFTTVQQNDIGWHYIAFLEPEHVSYFNVLPGNIFLNRALLLLPAFRGLLINDFIMRSPLQVEDQFFHEVNQTVEA